jgi:hypothetical protein
MRIIMQNNVQQGAVNLKVAVIVDEAQFAEFIHEAARFRSIRMGTPEGRFRSPETLP